MLCSHLNLNSFGIRRMKRNSSAAAGMNARARPVPPPPLGGAPFGRGSTTGRPLGLAFAVQASRQTACKPGSVRTACRRGTAIPLGRALPRASRDQPGWRGGNAPAPRAVAPRPAAPIRSCSRWGLPCRPRCQGRGALLPHRFTLARGLVVAQAAGGLFSVALSLGSPPPAVSRHRIPVEPGLSSSPGDARRQRPSGRLAGRTWAWAGAGVKRR